MTQICTLVHNNGGNGGSGAVTVVCPGHYPMDEAKGVGNGWKWLIKLGCPEERRSSPGVQ